MPALSRSIVAARQGGRGVVVPYVLVDRRRLRDLPATIDALRRGGAAAVELGFPFSDPIADGPVLAAAHDRALRHGTRWRDLLTACRIASERLPVAVMTYANPLWHRGLDASIGALAAAGASGLIVPDLALEEIRPFERSARSRELELVLLAAPGVSADRLATIAHRSRGFLYLVSRYGTTGRTRGSSPVDLTSMVRIARRAAPHLPVLVGFGVRDRASAALALASGADGVIVGSAVEERLARPRGVASLERWLRGIGGAARTVAG